MTIRFTGGVYHVAGTDFNRYPTELRAKEEQNKNEKWDWSLRVLSLQKYDNLYLDFFLEPQKKSNIMFYMINEFTS